MECFENSIKFLCADIPLPEKPKLHFLDKVPQLSGSTKPPKMTKRLSLMRGPEPIHNQLIHKQYGIVVSFIFFVFDFITLSPNFGFYSQALSGGRLHSGHMEMLRLTINRKMDSSKMYAVWRVDPPWQPLTRKVLLIVISSLDFFENDIYICI